MSNDDASPQSKPLLPNVILKRWQKRQATLLQHFSSLDYLVGLKELVDDFVNGVDITLDAAQRQDRDRYLVSERWGVRDTVANFSTYGFPALRGFQLRTDSQIASRATDFFRITDYNNCARTLGELSMNWSTPEEEEIFKAGMAAIAKYCGPLDRLVEHGWRDSIFDRYWRRYRALYPRLPRFRVRDDIEAESGKRPPRTGIYIPQDDPAACLEFAWTGSPGGCLPESTTFNELGLQAIAIVGREALWQHDPRLLILVKLPRYLKAFKEARHPFTDENDYLADPREPASFISKFGTERRPCKWFFVEHVESEWEEAEPEAVPIERRLRGEPGALVPATGWWHTIAISGKDAHRRLEQGSRFPDTRYGDRGQIIWNYDPNQQPESERIRMAREMEKEVATIVGRLETPRPLAATKPDETNSQPTSQTPPAEALTDMSSGLRIASGETCPKNGWWESFHTDGVKQVREKVLAGAPMPLVKLARKLTLWERLRNDPALIDGIPTTWKFVADLS